MMGGVELAIHDLIADIDQLTRLYHQLRQVPHDVQDVFDQLANSRQFLVITGNQLTRSDVALLAESDVSSGKAFRLFRSRLLDLELFLDPTNLLPRSGPGSSAKQVVPWDVTEHGDVLGTCRNFRALILQLNSDCQTLLSALLSPNQQSVAADADADADAESQVSSPSLAPSDASVQGDGDSRASTPASGRMRSRTRKIPDHLKTDEQRIVDRFIEQYSKPTAGTKRKRPERKQGDSSQPPWEGFGPFSQLLPHPFPGQSIGPPGFPSSSFGPPAPSFPPFPSPAYGFRERPDTGPEWRFDELSSALPNIPGPAFTQQPPRPGRPIQPVELPQAPSTPLPLSRNKGKQRVIQIQDEESSPSEFSSSSSGSIRSLPSIHSLPRDGSIISIASKDRTFREGSCKIWYHPGHQLQQLAIEHIEIRRIERAAGEGIMIVSRSQTGQEIIDDLWNSSSGSNSSPFLEYSDITAAFHQRDKNANFVVCFAPNPSHHPQYSFSTKPDCWDFMQAITSKTLCASLDVESIKSACTHGNSVESGCETIQIWDDRATGRRTIKFFRNKNAIANPKIVEFSINYLRFPEKEKRTGKLVLGLRDAQDGPTKEMRYLKIQFSNRDAEEGFLQGVGFSNVQPAAAAAAP